MGRTVAILPEVAGRIHQPRTEMVVPDPVDNHAGGQRIAWIGDPLCKLNPAQSFLCVLWYFEHGSKLGNGRERSRGNFFLLFEDATALEYTGSFRFPCG